MASGRSRHPVGTPVGTPVAPTQEIARLLLGEHHHLPLPNIAFASVSDTNLRSCVHA